MRKLRFKFMHGKPNKSARPQHAITRLLSFVVRPSVKKHVATGVVLSAISVFLIIAALTVGFSLAWTAAPNSTVQENGSGTTINSAIVDGAKVGYDIYKYDEENQQGIKLEDTEEISLNLYDRLFSKDNDKTSVILRAMVYGYDASTLTVVLSGQPITTTSFLKPAGTAIDSGNYLSNIINVKAAIIPGLTDASTTDWEAEGYESADDYLYQEAVKVFQDQEYTMDEDGNFTVRKYETSQVYSGGVGRFIRFSDMPTNTVLNSVTVTNVSAPSADAELLIKSGSNSLASSQGILGNVEFAYSAGTYADTVDSNDNVTSTAGTIAKQKATAATAWKFEATQSGGYQISTAVKGTRYYLAVTYFNDGTVRLSLSTSDPAVWYYNNGSLYAYDHSVTYDESASEGSRYTHKFSYYALGYSSGWGLTKTTTNVTNGSAAEPAARPSAPSGGSFTFQSVSIANPTVIEPPAASAENAYNKSQTIEITVSHMGTDEYDSGNRLFLYVQIDYDQALVNKYFAVNGMSLIIRDNPIPFSESFTLTLKDESST